MARHDAVLIRVSTDGQDREGQIANVRRMLKALSVDVPERHWFIFTESRRKVSNHADFKAFIAQVEADEIATAYVESPDRFGQTDVFEYLKIITTLCEHESQLISLKDGKLLTERSMMADMMALIQTATSDEKLRQTAYQSLRTRTANFTTKGTWPTGTQPFGYGKRCYAPDGTPKWEWQPISRSKGITYDFTPQGKRRKRNADPAKLPRKERDDIIKLVPSENKKFVRAVQRAFDLYTNGGLSRRAISKQLNDEGLTFYDKLFTHPFVTQILSNPAYVGDTHFGKTQAGELCTFNADGTMREIKGSPKKKFVKPKQRDESERLVMKDTHEALIDRKTWAKAQKKLAREKERTNYAPQNPNYYLKPLFVCGHCGKNLAGRTENGDKVVYCCSTYTSGKSNGHSTECGYHRISHEDAERLLMEKIEELELRFDPDASAGVREGLSNRYQQIEDAADDTREQIWETMQDGAKALIEYFKQNYELDTHQLNALETSARWFYRRGKLPRSRTKSLPIALREFKQAVKETEQAAIAQATERMSELSNDHEQFTFACAKASDRQQAVLKKKLDQIEAEMDQLEPNTRTVSERLRELYEREDDLHGDWRKLIDEWPTLENREKGEALRRIFNTVRLYWEATWHPAEQNPDRPRKTKRAGRYSYKLLTDKTEWDLADSNMVDSW